MGSYTFKWTEPADEVFVTGTFDDWSKSVKLVKKDGVFEKTVDLPKSEEKIYYKFVVDGNWTTNTASPSETDPSNNVNNVLYPSDIKTAPVPQTISSVGAGATTAALAGQVPKEGEKKDAALPGTFPETPAETGAEPQFSVNPIPATAGAGNPVQLKPGEKVPDPSTLTSNTVQSTVTNDSAALDKSQPAIAGAVADTKSSGKEENGGMFGVPPVSSTMIPESSLPMGDGTAKETENAGPTISSVGATSTTAALAGEVPKEPRGVPEVVTESQKEAKVDPEASASPDAVAEKKEVESELTKKVPEEPPAAESGKSSGGIIAGAAAGAAAGVTALAGAAYAAQAKAAQAVGLRSTPEPAAAVPEPVTESIKQADAPAEAASSPEAVAEKSKVEEELLKEVKTTNESGEPAPTVTAATTDKAPTETTTETKKPDSTPAAASAALAVPSAKETKPDSRDVSPLGGPRLPAPTEDTDRRGPTVTTGVETSTTETKTLPSTEKKAEPTTPAKSSVKNGESSKAAAATPATPESAKNGASPSTDKEKKKKRMSGFFGKIKEKLKG